MYMGEERERGHWLTPGSLHKCSQHVGLSQSQSQNLETLSKSLMQVVGAPVVKPSLLLYSDVDRKVAKKVEYRWPALPYTLICHAALPTLSKHQMPPSV